jgi:hypothetical protein
MTTLDSFQALMIRTEQLFRRKITQNFTQTNTVNLSFLAENVTVP